MNWMWRTTGRVAFWLSLPLIILLVRFRPRTRILITAGDQVLVTKNWLGDGRWSLPGGGIKGGEMPLAAAQREIHEEIGLKLAANQLKPVGNFTYRAHGTHFLCICFVVELGRPLPIKYRRRELVDAQWAARAQLNAKTAGPDVVNLIAVRKRK